MATKALIPLCELLAGESGTIIQLQGGHGLVGRLAALGFTPGVTLNMVRNPGRGPLIVSLLDTRIALGLGQAQHVQVRRD